MAKKLILERLWKTITMLVNLPDEKFSYDGWANETEEIGKTICGTVCCVGGWYPTYFPEANVKLVKNKHVWMYPSHPVLELVGITPSGKISTADVKIYLAKYHNLHKELIDCMFYGTVIELKPFLTSKGKSCYAEIWKSWRRYIDMLSSSDPYDYLYDYDKPVGTLNNTESTKEQVQHLFEFLYYMIQHDYIHNYNYVAS